MYENARAFISKALPWDDVSYVNLHYKKKMPSGTGVFWAGAPGKGVNDFVRALTRAMADKDITDIYVCMSSQRDVDEKVSQRTGRKYVAAKRHHTNAVMIKSFFIDCDVKDGAYERIEDASKALIGFCKAVGLPAPSQVVGSGYGLHSHWVLDKAISIYEWQPWAAALVKAAQEHGLLFDAQCTIDSVRLLRVPDTFNRKFDTVKPVRLLLDGPVYPLATITTALQKWVEVQTPVFEDGGTVRAPLPRANDELANGIEEGFKVNLDQVAKICPFFAHTLITGGAEWDNPTWMLSVGAAAHTDGGKIDAHRMSCNHPTYEVGATDALFDRLEAGHKGWPRCATIQAYGFSGCGSCKYRQQDKSPFNFVSDAFVTDVVNPANPIPAAVSALAGHLHLPVGSSGGVSDATMPSGFSRDANGYVSFTSIDEDGKQITIPIMLYPMREVWCQNDPWMLHFTTVTTARGTSKVSLTTAEIVGRDTFTKRLAEHGMMIKENRVQVFREFLVSWIQKLQSQKDAVVSSTPFGWAFLNGHYDGFAYGGRVWYPGGDRPAAVRDMLLTKQYSPIGAIDPWIKAARIITDQRRPALDAILAASFGAPLVTHTGKEGALINAFSTETGIGKTTTMIVAQAVWGDPVKGKAGLSDTPKSLYNKAGQLRHIPIFWDEVKGDEQMNKIAGMAYQIAQGREGGRLNSDISQRDPGTWQTIAVIAANDSMIDPIARHTKSSAAGIVRLFEFQVTKSLDMDTGNAAVSRQIGALNNNFGHAGLIYSKWLGESVTAVAANVAELNDTIEDRFSIKPEERYWSCAMTCMLAGASYANALELTDIDEVGLWDFLAETLDKMRGEVKDTPFDMANRNSVATVLGEFLGAMRARHTLYTDRVNTFSGRPVPGSISVIGDSHRNDQIHVQYGKNDGMLRISKTYMYVWLAEHDYPRHAFVKALKEEFGAVEVRAIMGSGTGEVFGTQISMVQMNLADARMQNFVEL